MDVCVHIYTHKYKHIYKHVHLQKSQMDDMALLQKYIALCVCVFMNGYVCVCEYEGV